MRTMDRFLVLAGVMALLGLPLDVHACDECNVYLGMEQHTVCGWWEGVLYKFQHCGGTSPADCNGHPSCPAEEEDAEEEEAVALAIDKLVSGDGMSFDELRSAIALTPRIQLNEERSAVQVVSCDGALVVGHLPVDPIMVSLLAQQ